MTTPSQSDLNKRSLRSNSYSLSLEAERRSIQPFKAYKPNSKQREFHALGAEARERLLLAGNQLGKTVAAGYETAMHLTGEYPAWWSGRRFDRPIHAWAASVSGEATRNNPQRVLLGEGAQPKAATELVGTSGIPLRARAVVAAAALQPRTLQSAAIPPERVIAQSNSAGAGPGALDGATIRHRSGGMSRLSFKSYLQGREKWQGPSLDLVWFDEEPPYDIYMEGLTRTNATGGCCYITFTPLQGKSRLFLRFWGGEQTGKMQVEAASEPNSKDRALVRMTLADADHYDEAQRGKLLESYDEDERQTRLDGLPSMKQGRIFTRPMDELLYDPADCPAGEDWAWIAGMDFGWDHPTAAVVLAWDRENDVVYVTDTYRESKRSAEQHADVLLRWGAQLWWSWPQDGLQTEKGSGRSLCGYYRELGLRMLPEPAKFADGGNSVEVGVMQMKDRIDSGRLRVRRDLADWAEEYQTYHRREGRIVKMKDDVLCATRYALMSLRFAQPRLAELERNPKRQLEPSEPWNPMQW